MSYMQENPYAYGAYDQVAAHAEENERTIFIRRTYTHLMMAVLAFVGLEAAFFTLTPLPVQQQVLGLMFGGRFAPLIVIGAFVAVSWIANSWAQSSQSLTLQYAGLGLYVVAEAVIFLPILFMAQRVPNAIPSAAIITAVVFGGLTAMVMMTRADFSWLGRYLWLAGLLAFGVALCGMIFGFNLGIFYSAALVALACGYILYDTSNVMHQYRTTQYVAASLALFASVALLFYYILRIMMSTSRER